MNAAAKQIYATVWINLNQCGYPMVINQKVAIVFAQQSPNNAKWGKNGTKKSVNACAPKTVVTAGTG